MKFSSAILSAALFLGVSTTSSNAFSSYNNYKSTNNAPVRAGGKQSSSSALASTMEDKTVDTTIDATTANAAPVNGLNDTARPSLAPEFQKARDSAVKALTSSLPNPALMKPLVHFMDEYFCALATAAHAKSTNPDGSDITPQQAMQAMMTTLNYGMKYGLGMGPKGKFYFEDVRHKALRGNYKDERYDNEEMTAMLGDDVNVDFYAAGCDFFRPAMDLKNSLVLGKENLVKAKAQLDAGENVIFLANHQSEADPQVVSCLFESVSEEFGNMAAHVTFVAGHKVTTDSLAVPFSMGRNLLCIHSKKHIDADPETKPAKSKQNMAAMNSMLIGLKEGGMAIWVAPSGGRDRRDVSTGKIPIAPFDQKTVDMFRLMGNKSKVPTHFYPMSMVSYDLCPPPDFIEAGVGEQRNVRFTPVGIAISDEVSNIGGAEKRHLFTEHAEKEAMDGYVQLLKGLGMESYIP